MHLEILNDKQKKILPWLKEFSSSFGLVGGTALALQIGHRQSIDFDLFSNKPFNNLNLLGKILKHKKITKTLIDHDGELTVVIEGVKITFLYYPFKINFNESVNKIIKMSDILTLAALKAYALSRRAKWKDYVDLYFILKKFYSLTEIINKAQQIFSGSFNEKIFRTQLAYFQDLDYSEKVIYQKGYNITDSMIKKFLIKVSLQ